MQKENQRQHRAVESRHAPFVERTVTEIWLEKSTAENPYIASQVYCHGYDLIELMKNRSFVDVLFLLLMGELPNTQQKQLLEATMIGMINPGPRHPATQAAMSAAVGKTNPLHILPIGIAILGGNYLGAGTIEETITFFDQHKQSDIDSTFKTLIQKEKNQSYKIPGFGKRYGGTDPIAAGMAQHLASLDAAGEALTWGEALAKKLKPFGQNWLMTGIVAAVFSDLKIPAHLGGPLYQLMSAPGLLAHGAELIKKPITAMPFVTDDHYQIELD
jgi:citrate synthase